MNRSAFYLIGFAMGLVGWAVMFSGLTTLNPSLSPTGAAMGIGEGLTPPKGFLSTGATGTPVTHPGIHHPRRPGEA